MASYELVMALTQIDLWRKHEAAPRHCPELHRPLSAPLPHKGVCTTTNKEGSFIKATEALVIVASTCVKHSELVCQLW